MKKFAVFDIDGTLIRWQLYHAVVEKLAKEGFIEGSAYQKIKDARMTWKRREDKEGFRNYEQTLVQEYNQAIKSITTTDFDNAVNQVIDEYKDQTYTYTRDLIHKLKQKGYVLLAISGSQAELVAHIAAYYKFDDYTATEYARAEEGFSGDVVVGSENKSAALTKLVEKHSLMLEDSYGVGDSESDAPMLAIVEHPIAFNPDEKLFKIARKNRWKVVVERKNMVYELEVNDGIYVLA